MRAVRLSTAEPRPRYVLGTYLLEQPLYSERDFVAWIDWLLVAEPVYHFELIFIFTPE